MVGGQEIIFIFVVLFILFGDKKFSELMKKLEKGIKKYNKWENEMSNSDKNVSV